VITTGTGRADAAQIIPALTAPGETTPYVSPWTVFAAPYADGSQAALTTPNDGVAKYLISAGQLRPVHFLPLDRNPLDFDWGILALQSGDVVVTEQRRNRLVVVGDERRGDPTSPLEVKRRIDVRQSLYGDLNAHLSLAPDGTLIALTDANKLIAVDLAAGRVVASFDLPSDSGASFQNSFPIDERGRIFVAA